MRLFSKDPYKPSSIAAQVLNTRPQIAYRDTAIPSPPLTLSSLDQLNSVGSKGGDDIYLTSTVDITKNPTWIEGIKPDSKGVIGDEKTAVIVVVDKGNGTVDAFYMYFWAFNWGGVVLKKQLGDHVGDWYYLFLFSSLLFVPLSVGSPNFLSTIYREHNMIRFINGAPKFVWFSQHSNGEAFKFEILKKDPSGKRPIAYAANGSHALYATPGPHDHTIPNLNLPVKFLLVDETDDGPLYDPVPSSYCYSYAPSTSTFTPIVPTPSAPTGFLRFKGRWGDQEYPDSDKRQDNLVGNKKYVGGPTGPADKQLDRKEVWPQNSFSKGQKIRTSLGIVGFKAWFRGLNSFGKKQKKTKVLVSGEVVN